MQTFKKITKPIFQTATSSGLLKHKLPNLSHTRVTKVSIEFIPLIHTVSRHRTNLFIEKGTLEYLRMKKRISINKRYLGSFNPSHLAINDIFSEYARGIVWVKSKPGGFFFRSPHYSLLSMLWKNESAEQRLRFSTFSLQWYNLQMDERFSSGMQCSMRSINQIIREGKAINP